jgi:hypothetical protein
MTPSERFWQCRFQGPGATTSREIEHFITEWADLRAADCPCEVSCHLLSSWLRIGGAILSLVKER